MYRVDLRGKNIIKSSGGRWNVTVRVCYNQFGYFPNTYPDCADIV